ncbi:DegV family protein [uncultured Thermanaerothrix sp.]|uniref:DegV family protein n=1 Tax=uncultured Thermanaerothrix sp. TaxID=1195149 RepID=UPI002636230C|nr:DegV family protein [uncultured Thermanaerothrix sp.]
MLVVTDSAADFAPGQIEGLDIHVVPLYVMFGETTYRSGVDIDYETFYDRLRSGDMPRTSQPSVGEFVSVYRTLAARDAEILSIHLSSALSGTLSAARMAATMVPEAKITFFDSGGVSVIVGWCAEMAARAVRAGWPLQRILQLLEQIREKMLGIFMLPTLKYIIAGGRVGHLRGLMGTLMNIKPIMGFDLGLGTIIEIGKEFSLRRAILAQADYIAKRFAPGTRLRVQVAHSRNLEGATLLMERLKTMFECCFLPPATIGPVLGAHGGEGIVGVGVAPMDIFEDLA